MSRLPSRIIALCAAALLLASCGDFPRPFMGRPGALGSRLSQPPPSRLAVTPPGAALLTDAAAVTYATAVADALGTEAIPAVAAAPKTGDWRLDITADIQGSGVVPHFALVNPSGETKGSIDGPPVPAEPWSNGDTAALQKEAEAAAPVIVNLMTTVQAAIQLSDPNSLVNRPARIQFLGVTGAPGDGNQALAQQMRADLAKLGLLVQDDPGTADFSLRAEVHTTPANNAALHVDIQWIVDDPKGERGRIVQINEVPAAALAPYWGDVAVVAAQEAAGGVHEVIANQTAAHRLAGDTPAAAK